jgi:hypothetical protein
MQLLAHDLCSLFTLCHMPAILILHWNEVTQSRMQSTMIVKGHPVQHGIQGLLPGSELLVLQAGRL